MCCDDVTWHVLTQTCRKSAVILNNCKLLQILWSFSLISIEKTLQNLGGTEQNWNVHMGILASDVIMGFSTIQKIHWYYYHVITFTEASLKSACFWLWTWRAILSPVHVKSGHLINLHLPLYHKDNFVCIKLWSKRMWSISIADECLVSLSF